MMSQIKQSPTNTEVGFENRLNQHREGEGALSLGDSEQVAKVSTGEEVAIDTRKFNSVHSIYAVLKKYCAKQAEDNRRAALTKLQDDLGVTPDTRLSPASAVRETTLTTAGLAGDAGLTPAALMSKEAPLPEARDDANTALEQFMHALAEKIYQALERCHETIAAIKPASIDSTTVSLLGEPGDANFVLAAGQGEALYAALQAAAIKLDTIERNDYGFVMKNDELGFTVMFIYQERLHQDGSPKSLEELEDQRTPDEDTNSDGTKFQVTGQKSANQSNYGNTGSLAA